MLSERRIERINMPLPAGAELLHPERAVLVFGPTQAFDIGAFCYKSRSWSGRSRKCGTRPRCEMLVDLDSFELSRVEPIRAAIKYFSELVTLDGRRVSTAGRFAVHYRLFFNYAEANGHCEMLTNPSTVRAAFHGYVKYLAERVKANTLSTTSAVGYQGCVLMVLSALTGIEILDHGVDLVRMHMGDRKVTEPPPEQDQAKVLALCRALFEGLSTFCLENKCYPYALAVPRFMATPHDELYIFPSSQWCMPPYRLATRESSSMPLWAFDYESGTVATVESIKHHYSQKYGAVRAVALAKSAVDFGNATIQNIFRRNAAFTAHNVFLLLFLANTGMNAASMAALLWSGDYEIGVERQGFRTIKYRAAGRSVSFEIQSVFMQSFRKFLKLRAYLLDGRDFERLFMSRPTNARSISRLFDLKPLSYNALWGVNQILLNIEPNLPVLMSRKFRAAKSDWLLRNADPATTAIVLQNSMQTVLKSYAEGSPRSQEDELSRFFDGLRTAVIAKGEPIKNGVEIPVGVCLAHGSPNQCGPAPIDSDCITAEGCLFCDKFKVHADDRDIRKLASCRYCIERTAHLADSEEQFQKLFGPIFDRIRNLLDEIKRRCPTDVARIVREVEAGELDPYWSSKLEMLINLELVL